jgi:hypothetical protein
MLGLTMEEAEAAQLFEIWPDCELSVSVFAAMSTQWQAGPMGPTGLNYASLPVVLQRMKVTDSDTVFDDLRVMELAALKLLRAK